MHSNAKSSIENDLCGVAGEVAGVLGLEIVEIHLRKAGRKWRVRLDIDRAGPAGVQLEDCERVSSELGRLLDERDVMQDSYLLEVSSPGLDRPIRSDDDIRRNTGRRIVVECSEPIEERRSFRGVLSGVSGEAMIVREDDGTERAIPRSGIVSAHQEIEFS